MKFKNLTEENVINFIKKNGYLSVSWRWRESGLRNFCKQMAVKKKLVITEDRKGRTKFTVNTAITL